MSQSQHLVKDSQLIGRSAPRNYGKPWSRDVSLAEVSFSRWTKGHCLLTLNGWSLAKIEPPSFPEYSDAKLVRPLYIDSSSASRRPLTIDQTVSPFANWITSRAGPDSAALKGVVVTYVRVVSMGSNVQMRTVARVKTKIHVLILAHACVEDLASATSNSATLWITIVWRWMVNEGLLTKLGNWRGGFHLSHFCTAN